MWFFWPGTQLTLTWEGKGEIPAGICCLYSTCAEALSCSLHVYICVYIHIYLYICGADYANKER